MDLSLERIRLLLSHLPRYSRPTIHIAGTNGKGSVSAFVASILQTSGFTVGKFNSPHLVSVLDCITVDGEPVSAASYDRARKIVEDANAEHGIGATSFELLTATALTVLEAAKVDVVILEVGMGGRADATNAILDECVLVSALTAVDLDHQKFLGNNVGEIAMQKAGIARKGRPFVVGPQKHTQVFDAVKVAVEKAGADLVYALPAATREWDDAVDGPLQPITPGFPSSLHPTPMRPVSLSLPSFPQPVLAQLPLQGDHQLDNLGVAASIVSTLLLRSSDAHPLPFRQRITPDTVAAGARSTSWAGRLSFHDVPLSRLYPPGIAPEDTKGSLVVLADGAHNPASSTALAAYISHLLERAVAGGTLDLDLTFVLALSHSPPKTPLQTLTPLLLFTRPAGVQVTVNVAATEFTPVAGMPWVKNVPRAEIHEAVRLIDSGVNLWVTDDGTQTDVANALLWAHRQQQAHARKGLIIVAGSLYLVADFYRMLQ
ncbi:Mur ligase [Gloeopeniophorella convolvens]|nr:Mur ligase [Gloeopeniophorella convolvens]